MISALFYVMGVGVEGDMIIPKFLFSLLFGMSIIYSSLQYNPSSYLRLLEEKISYITCTYNRWLEICIFNVIFEMSFFFCKFFSHFIYCKSLVRLFWMTEMNTLIWINYILIWHVYLTNMYSTTPMSDRINSKFKEALGC